jgi:outer membrane protein TolC
VAVFAAALNQRAYSQSLDFNDVPDADNLNLRGTVAMTLYAGGRIAAERRAARANLAAAAALADTVRDALSFETARMFFTILKARGLIRAAEASVVSFERNLGIASARVESGSVLKTDALDMQVRLAQARENLVQVRNARALAEHGLRTLLALEAGAVIVDDAPPALAVPADPTEARRPELIAIREQQRAAEAEVRRATAGYQPRVNAVASLEYNRGWELDGDGTNYGAGVVAEWDLWDGRLTHGRISEAQARLGAVKEEERKLRLAIALEIDQARLQLDEAVERLSVTAAAIAQAEESADLTRIRFEQGRATSTQVIDAETALTSARVQRVGATADRDIAIAALRKALGLPLLEGGVTQ